MLKKFFLSMMAVAVLSSGFVACSNGDDDDDDDEPMKYTVSYTSSYGTAPESISVEEGKILTSEQLPDVTVTGVAFGGWYDGETKAVADTYKVTKDVTLSAKWTKVSAYYGSYKGSMTVNGVAQEVSFTVSADSFALTSGHPATYTKVLWLTNDDGNIVVAAQSDSTNTKNGDLSTGNYTTAASNYVVFGTDGTATYTVPAMAAMGGTASVTNTNASLYGTYTGTMSVTYGGKTTETPVSITVSATSVDQGGNYGAYTNVLWLTNSDGYAVVAAQSDSTNTKNCDLTADNYTTASSCYITFGNTVTYVVPAMVSMGGTVTLTKSE